MANISKLSQKEQSSLLMVRYSESKKICLSFVNFVSIKVCQRQSGGSGASGTQYHTNHTSISARREASPIVILATNIAN